MSRLDALVEEYPLPSWRSLAWTAMIVLASAAAWAWTAQLDEVAIAKGEVIPQGKIKTIQHLEGGIIQRIFIAEGAAVREGDSLLLLELPVSSTNRAELMARLDGLVINRARLTAEANEQALAFPAKESAARPEMVRAERETYEARRAEFAALMQGINEQVRQRELAVREFEASRRAKQSALRLAKEKFKISSSLIEKELTSRLDHIQLEREVDAVEGELAQLAEAIPRAQSSLAEIRERARQERLRLRREASEALSKVEVEIQRTKELAAEASEQVRRAEIKSPLDGVVKNMRYVTIGGVVRPGEAIMEIVPSDESLVVEAKLNPVDRGYVEIGQRAVVKVSSYDYTRYGGLEGRVTIVAADANTDPVNGAYFKVVVTTERDFLGDRPDRLRITPGMQAEVDIHTGTKSVMNYLVKPVLKLKHESFRER
ncbi:MAG: HlyD family type I secretion periplasmic adaptor subunit [Alphaproteobacteria bacterium]|nr:HlyD family type I secretion periplasmic adaptor subunit [Alphaproteobacteria bacterium]